MLLHKFISIAWYMSYYKRVVRRLSAAELSTAKTGGKDILLLRQKKEGKVAESIAKKELIKFRIVNRVP